MKQHGIDVMALAEARAKDLLVLSLSHRADLSVLENDNARGYDFLIQIDEAGSVDSNKVFWIELKAAVREVQGPRVTLPQDRAELYAESPLPLCLFFYEMNDDIGYYAWMVEPTVTPTGKPELVVNPRLLARSDENIELKPEDFTKVDAKSLDRLAASVNAWYDARRTHREAA